MKTKHVDTTTLEGLKQAERLQARGWRVVSINSITNVVTLTKD
jgi:hypothetical protein